MHKRRLNELVISGILEPAGPILIKSGMESGADPTLPSMNFVRTQHPQTGERTIYLPGSSLKGAVRSYVERIIRTVITQDDPKICCDPLGNESCGKRIDQKNKGRPKDKPLSPSEEYQELCLACRIFGHTAHAGHFISSDAYPLQPIDGLQLRQGVAINRFSGGVGVGPFEMEVATSGQFQVKFSIINFEIWQIGLLALALRDMAEGRLLIGFGKSRGLGQVNLHLTQLEIAYPGRFEESDFTQRLYGLSALAPDGSSKDYDLVKENDICQLPPGGRLTPESVAWARPEVTFGVDKSGDTWQDLDDAARGAAHQTVLSVLATTVPAWVKKAKEVNHA